MVVTDFGKTLASPYLCKRHNYPFTIPSLRQITFYSHYSRTITGILLILGIFAAIYEKLTKYESSNHGKVKTQLEERITIANIRKALKTELISVEPITVVPLYMSGKNKINTMDAVTVRLDTAEKNAHSGKI